MDIDWNAEIRAQLETHWTRQLRPRLEGPTDEEYFWEPVPGMWTLRPAENGFACDFTIPPPEPAPVTTIAWRMGHVAVLLEAGLQRFGRPPVDFASFPYAGTAEEALRQLDNAYRAWTEGVGALSVDGLTEPEGPAAPCWPTGPPRESFSTLSGNCYTMVRRSPCCATCIEPACDGDAAFGPGRALPTAAGSGIRRWPGWTGGRHLS